MEDKITTTSDRPGQVSRHTANFEKIKRTLGWQPTVVFEDGMKQVVDWYKNNRQWWEQKLEMKQVPIEVDGGKTELQ
jgi:dTDP-glucose 4,6-dehydratase